jgi:NADPH2:quinone reductase
MKGVWIEKTGGTEVLQYKTDIPVPEPKEGQVLVKNEYIGINYIDTFVLPPLFSLHPIPSHPSLNSLYNPAQQIILSPTNPHSPHSYFRTGLYPLPSTPYILGREASGTIAALGPSNAPSDLQPNTRVAYMGPSAYAQYTAVDTKYVVPIPDSIDTQTAAASILQALTALTLIREAHAVQKGDWVLVTAAAGGVGLWLCQLLHAIGARTIATASSSSKRDLAKEYGAEVTLGYNEEDRSVFVKEVMDITGGEGVAAVFDSVGKATFDSVLAVVKRKGSLISFGNASGAVTDFALG